MGVDIVEPPSLVVRGRSPSPGPGKRAPGRSRTAGGRRRFTAPGALVAPPTSLRSSVRCRANARPMALAHQPGGTMNDVTRAAFLGRGARGGLALVAGGSVLAAAGGSA